MKMIKRIPTFSLLFLFIFILMLFSILLPKNDYSTLENKYLAKIPTPTVKSVIDGSFETKYANYLSDQFPERSVWISIKSLTETFLLKTENNGIVYGKNGYLFPKFQSFDESTYWDNVKSIVDFADAAETPVRVIVVPSAYTILTDYIPSGMPAVNEKEELNKCLPFLTSQSQFINVWDKLEEAQHDYVFYRTDHHWTTYGAYLAYLEYCETAGLIPYHAFFDAANTVDNFLGTSYSKCKKLGAVPDIISYFPFDATISFEGKSFPNIYDFTKLTTRDKYAMFLHGNHAESIIESGDGRNKRSSLLIIKDSYADSMIPFLTQNYASITCIDPRYYLDSIQELAKGDYDDILILLGFENLSCESNWVKLSF